MGDQFRVLPVQRAGWRACGTGAAFLYSLVATLAPDLFPLSFMAHGRIGVYFEAAAVIISLTLLGQMLELRARSQTSAAIKSLLGSGAEDRTADPGRWQSLWVKIVVASIEFETRG